jgi:hypothetical protein
VGHIEIGQYTRHLIKKIGVRLQIGGNICGRKLTIKI